MVLRPWPSGKNRRSKALGGVFAAFAVILEAQVPKSTAPDEVALISLNRISTSPVPSLGLQLLAMPQVCTSDGSIFALTATTASIGDLVSIAPDGKTVTNFGVQKINDLKNPRIISFFVSDRGVYLLVSTHESEESKDATILQSDGTVKAVKTTVVKGRHYAIAKFKTEGTYVGSIWLDVPFTPQQFGAFSTGDFLIAGIKTDVLGTQRTTASQLALVASSGQFLKQIDLKQDPNSHAPADNSGFGDWYMLTSLSEIVPDGDNLLLVRPAKNTPLFSISPGGEASAMNLQIPEGYGLGDLKVSGTEWIGLIARGVSGTDSQLLSFDRNTGKALAQYVYPPRVGLALACVDHDEFTFVTAQEEDNKMALTKLARR